MSYNKCYSRRLVPVHSNSPALDFRRPCLPIKFWLHVWTPGSQFYVGPHFCCLQTRAHGASNSPTSTAVELPMV